MPIYITLINWTDQGRAKAGSLPDRTGEVEKRIQAAGGKVVGNWLTMGRYDQVGIVEAPDDETAAALLMIIAERGNAITETLRAFTMDEVRGLLQTAGEIAGKG
ncbi:MAG: GYD domain-containing protein [Actinomycetota bacterium]